MNADFPRIITLLRKERNISQKQAAADLGVSQALLSHYEKGIRECGLEFLVKAADYYNVSCDYLLGRCAEPMGKSEPANEVSVSDIGNALTPAQQQLIDSQRLIFSMLDAPKFSLIEKNVREYLNLAVYRLFRLIYSANPKNDKRFFTINSPAADSYVLSAMELKKANAENSAKSGDMQNTVITTNSISESYAPYAPSLLNSIKQCEELMNRILPSEEDK